MSETLRPGALAVSTLAAAILLASAGAAAAQVQPQPATTTVDGTIVEVSAAAFTVTAADGSRRAVAVSGETLILARQAAKLDSIKAGDALGVASRRGSDGSLIANSINIFSLELWARVRKGQFPMQSGDTMTNAVVSQAETRVDGRVLYLAVEDRTAAIRVPEGIPINRSVTEKVSDLKVGMRVVARGVAGPDGVIAATTINFDLPPQG
jgi:hypothetical protein